MVSMASTNRPGAAAAAAFFIVFLMSAKSVYGACLPVSSVVEDGELSSPFSLQEYARAPWFSQLQAPTPYQPLTSFYCVVAHYTPQSLDCTPKSGNNSRSVITSKPVACTGSIDVFNYGNEGSVNGRAQGGHLRAIIGNTNDTSKLSVGPTFLPSIFYGPYWIVALGAHTSDTCESPSGTCYDWSLVSGGQPTIETADGCKGTASSFGGGLWILTREAEPPVAMVEKALDAAIDRGFDISIMKPVTHAGCRYDGFPFYHPHSTPARPVSAAAGANSAPAEAAAVAAAATRT